MRHQPICGYNYDPPPQEPEDTFVIGQRYNPPQPVEEKQVVIGGRHTPTPPDSRELFVVGSRYQEEGPVRCAGGVGCGAPQDRMMMMMMDTSGLPVIGIARNKRNQRIRRRRKIKA